MRVIVVGGGLVGSTLAAKLAEDGADVVLIERSRELVNEINDRLDVQTLVGNGATMPVLRSAGIERADLLVATTDSDEANMVVALVGSSIFRVPKVVARLRDPDHEESLRSIAKEDGGLRLGINPERAAVDRILALLPVPGAVDVAPFFEGRLLVAGFNIGAKSDFNGLLLSHLNLLFPAVPVLVVAIRRDDQWIVPHGDDEIRADDMVYFALDPSELDNVLSMLGLRRGSERRVMVVGASRIGLALARRLEATGHEVTLIDGSLATCQAAAAELSSTVVVHGSPTDRDLLVEEGADRVAGFVACSDDHEENLVACLLARRVGAAQTMAVVDNAALSGLVSEIGIGAVISPRLLSVSVALQFARKGKVRAVAALMDDSVEVLEIEAAGECRLAGSPLKDLGLPRGALVAAVQRGDELLVPGGDDKIEIGDRVLLITSRHHASRLDPFLEE